MTFPQNLIHPHLITLMILGAALLFSNGCIDAVDGPDITSVTVTPGSISKSETGMTDESFTVVIQTSGFESELTGATVAIQDLDPPLEGQPLEDPTISGDTITLRILKSWLGGLDEGTYSIETTVTSELTTIKQGNSATVTITPN